MGRGGGGGGGGQPPEPSKGLDGALEGLNGGEDLEDLGFGWAKLWIVFHHQSLAGVGLL